MSSAASSSSHLRLVGAEDPDSLDAWRRTREARQEIIRENRIAASDPRLQPTDPRWVLAAKVHAHLEGSSLPPERRARLMKTAQQIGIRPFDANLIMAIVQDHARRGERLETIIPTLTMIEPEAKKSPRRLWLHVVAAVVCALVANAFLVWWFTAI